MGRAVELLQQLGDRGIEGRQREEGQVAQPRQHPSLRNLDADLRLGLVARVRWTRGQHHRAVVAAISS